MAQKSAEKILPRIISGLARALDSGNNAVLIEIDRLLNSDSPILPLPKPKKGSSRPLESNKEVPSSAAADELRETLSAFESREELGNFIAQKYETKTDLIAALRLLKVPVNKNDDHESITEKLIDAMIGYKLRSRAIRGDVK